MKIALIKKLLPLVFVTFSVSGCFDYSEPITSSPTKNINKKLIGKWKLDCSTGCDGIPRYITISSKNDDIYVISTVHDVSYPQFEGIKAWHSDIPGYKKYVDLITLQNAHGKYEYAKMYPPEKDTEFNIYFADGYGSDGKKHDLKKAIEKKELGVKPALVKYADESFAKSATYKRVGLSESQKQEQAKADEESRSIEDRKRLNPEFQRCIAQRHTCLAQCPPYRVGSSNDFHYSCNSQCNAIVCYY